MKTECDGDWCAVSHISGLQFQSFLTVVKLYVEIIKITLLLMQNRFIHYS